jgi:hypothetical protein
MGILEMNDHAMMDVVDRLTALVELDAGKISEICQAAVVEIVSLRIQLKMARIQFKMAQQEKK